MALAAGTLSSIGVPPAAAGSTTTTIVSELAGVSCATVTFCVAVGQQIVSTAASSSQNALIETYNGSTWIGLSTPAVTTGDGSALLGVSCPSATFCMATGYDSSSEPLVLTWDGSSWSTLLSGPTSPLAVPEPMAFGEGAELSGVSCVSSAYCVAVGRTGASTVPNHGLLAAYSNGQWTTATTAVTKPVAFTAVSCASTAFCLAVGITSVGNPYTSGFGNIPNLNAATSPGNVQGAAVAEVWDGTSWSIAFSNQSIVGPVPPLWGVSCPEIGFCAAVGDPNPDSTSSVSEGSEVTYTTGGGWVCTPAGPVDSATVPLGVSCVSGTTTGQTVGATSTLTVSNPGSFGAYLYGTFVSTYNGTSWSSGQWAVPSGSSNNQFSGVNSSRRSRHPVAQISGSHACAWEMQG